MPEEVKTGVVDIETATATFEELRGELGRIGIWRNGSYLGKHLPEEVDGDLIDWVRDTYGGGRYQVVLYGKDGKVKKRLSFVIAGEPKEPGGGQSSGEKEGTIELLRELINRLDEKKGGSNETIAVFQMMMQMQQQQFQLLLQTMKEQKRESSLVDKFIDRVLANPAVLMGAGGAIWKLLQKAISSKNELLELIKVAKEDPELKELAIQAVGAKYGGTGGIIDRILGNPELLNKTLEIVNKALTIRESGQNPLPVVKKELRELAGAPQGRTATAEVGAPQSGMAAARVMAPQEGNSQSTPEPVPVVDNQANQEVVQVQEVIATGTKILELVERGLGAEAIWEALSDREIDILVALVNQYQVGDAEGLVRFLEKLPVPRFTVAGYVEAIRRHRQVVDELLSYCIVEELQEAPQEGDQEGEQGAPQGETEQVQRETEGSSQVSGQEGHRETTGEG